MHNQDFLSLVEELRPQIQEMATKEIAELINNEKNKDSITLIDVREEYEWNTGHIPHARHIARGVLEREISNINLNKDSQIILYCAGGFRSVLAAYNLQQMGYTNVYSMQGGIREWLNLGFNLGQ